MTQPPETQPPYPDFEQLASFLTLRMVQAMRERDFDSAERIFELSDALAKTVHLLVKPPPCPKSSATNRAP